MKRPFNLTLSEDVVTQARRYSANLSATVESLLAEYVVNQRHARASVEQMARACTSEWNGVHEQIGSFADEHSTL